MTTYSKNLTFLEKYAPVLYRTVLEESDYYVHELSQIDKHDFRLAYNEKECWLNSTYSVADELDDVFSTIDKDTEVLILFGIGNGEVFDYIKGHFYKLKALYIVEPFLGVFKKYIENHELSDVFMGLGDITFIVNKDAADSGQLLVEILAESSYNQIEIATQPSYNCLMNNYIQDFREKILRGFRSKVSQMVTLDKTKYKWLRNTINNLKSDFTLQQSISRYLKGKPGVIIGAGPSLNQHLPLLNDLKDRAVMIGASSAIKILNSNGVKPHFKMVVDAYPDSSIYDDTFFAEENANPLLFAGQSFDEVVAGYKGPKIFMLLPTDVFGSYIMGKAGVDLKYISSGASVVQSAFSFLAESGCDPIILLGQDMCFYNQKLYADGIESMDQSSFDAAGYIPMKDIYGNDVYTVRNYLQIKYDYESLIARYPKVRVINATEGGLGISNAESLTLKFVMDNILVEPIGDEIVSMMDIIHDHSDSEKLNLTKIFEEALAELDEVLRINEQRFKYLKKLDSNKEKYSILRLKSDFEYIDKVMLDELNNNEIYNLVIKNNIATQIMALKQMYRAKTKDFDESFRMGMKYYYGLFTEIEIFTQVCRDWIQEYLDEFHEKNFEKDMV